MRFILITTLLIVTVLVLIFLNLALGSSKIPLTEVLNAVLGLDTHKPIWQTIVLEFRLPRSITACLAGSALSISGLIMQTLFRNPLAGPGVLGVSSGAGLGVAVVLLGGLDVTTSMMNLFGSLSLAGAAFIGSFFILGIVILISRKVKSAVSLLIIGLMMGYLSSALVNLLTYFSSAEQIRNYAIWSLGSFGDATWSNIQILTMTGAISIFIAIFFSNRLDILLLGENYAQSMGLKVKQTRIGLILAASLSAGSVTAFCGPIAFLGLAVPHLSRRLLGNTKHIQLIPTAVFMGMAVALASDLLAKLPGSDQTLPLNTITALIGAPIVIGMVLKRQGWSY